MDEADNAAVDLRLGEGGDCRGGRRAAGKKAVHDVGNGVSQVGDAGVGIGHVQVGSHQGKGLPLADFEAVRGVAVVDRVPILVNSSGKTA